jgi:alkanesulfonate monooxygenase SsuD/methylene tetrahydromethanopterin reductase-like flavin-dependent oxidoreductase (luciferase family)
VSRVEFDISAMGGASSVQDSSLEAILEQARLVERLGFDGYWGSDHQYSLGDKFKPHLDRFVVLTAVATATERIRIGPLVVGNTYRHPVILAKLATGVDIVSRGRLDLGIGTGWTKPEHAAYGIPFPDYADRLEALDEALTVLKLLWTEREATFEGKHYQLDGAPFEPKPVQDPHPPRVVGGNSRALLRVVARNADEWTAGMGSPRFLEGKVKLFEACCAEAGRDADGLKRSTLVPARVFDEPGETERFREEYLAGEKRRVAAGHAQKIKWIAEGEDPWEAIWNMMLVGTPDHIIRGIERLRDLGFTRIIFGTEDPHHMTRLAQEVLPAFR